MSFKLVAQTPAASRDWKRKHDSRVYKNTISQKQINDTERRCNLHITRYNIAAKALIRLGHTREEEYPVLTVTDMALKSRSLQCQLGDCTITNGVVWGQGAISVGFRLIGVATAPTSKTSGEGSLQPAVSGSQTKKLHHKEGWLWTFKVGKMDQEELRRWMDK
ncbi:hypothetical protein B0H14DRAFT_2634805, partial [Mycena olivaceomarginata]